MSDTAPASEQSFALTPGEFARLAYARHTFWCNSSHHQTQRCLGSMSDGVDEKAIKHEGAVLEEIIRERVADALEAAAADPELRLSGHSGVSISRLRQRAAATRVAPDPNS